MPQGRAGDPLERLLVVGVAPRRAGQARLVEDERGAEHRHAPDQEPLELEREPPALRGAGLEQRVGAGRAQGLRVRRAEQDGRAAVDHALGGAERHDEIRLDERPVDAQQHASGRAQLDELRVLGVVDRDRAGEAASEGGGDDPEALQVALRRPALEAAGDEQRLTLAGNPRPLELGRDRREGRLARVDLRGRQRQCRRLDHDRCAASPRRHRRERLAGEREAEGVPQRRANVGDRLAGRRRPQDDGVLRSVDDHDAAPGQEREFHGMWR